MNPAIHITLVVGGFLVGVASGHRIAYIVGCWQAARTARERPDILAEIEEGRRGPFDDAQEMNDARLGVAGGQGHDANQAGCAGLVAGACFAVVALIVGVAIAWSRVGW